MESQFTRKAVQILRANIETLLIARHEDQKALAEWCGHDKSWMNKFLNEGRGVTLKDFDRIADFFGLQTYQLFQPGISSLTERRTMNDRRSGQDRRVGHQGRQLASLRHELNKVPAMASSYGPTTAARHSPVPEEVQQIIARADKEITAVYARRQAATPRPPRTRIAKGDRGTG